jgi:hypothetical protein
MAMIIIGIGVGLAGTVVTAGAGLIGQKMANDHTDKLMEKMTQENKQRSQQMADFLKQSGYGDFAGNALQQTIV